ncbi:reverse transcriptase family protein [Cellulomonas sp. McL0617]|uniref:reverse transcriptase family protein n=1 Tax=Cellulomonas sp. McL0617 TaxID=3415675 RepID=UPI003CE9E36C
MDSLPPHRYRQLGLVAGVGADVLESAAAQHERNEISGTQPILSLAHLSRLTGASHDYLRSVVERRQDPYTEISKPKRSGGRRAIAMPHPLLMSVQRFILRSSLSNLSLHPRSFAYQQGRSAVDCASLHIGAKWLIKLDLHDFFGSISDAMVYPVFRDQGYSELVSFELMRLCTRGPWLPQDLRRRDTLMEAYPAIPSYASGSRGFLPQGAPTSGALANAVATPLDHALFKLSSARGLVYTRYSDDLTFSSAGHMSRADAATVVGRVARLVSKQGLVLHHKKTRVIPPRARHVVLGLVVGADEVRLRPEFRRQVEVHVHSVGARGLFSHAEARGFTSVLGMVSYVDGCLAYAAGVEPEWAHRQRREWAAALTACGFPR